MKKFYSFILAILTLLSCVVFSACGDKYKNLSINVYSSDGQVLDSVNFVIDETKEREVKTLGIEFTNIDSEDVGQIVVYSMPGELIACHKYSYNQNMCYVEISPNMPSAENSKLVVAHLASGKKKEIDLNIQKKANSLSVIDADYVVSIPTTETYKHTVDLTKVVSLMPIGSTDKLYFKISSGNIEGVTPIGNDEIGVDDVYSGFEITSNLVKDGGEITVYPVTYMEGYDTDPDKYDNKLIKIRFERVLSEDNWELISEHNLGSKPIMMVANDENLNSFKLEINYLHDVSIDEDDHLLKDSEYNFYDLYNISAISMDPAVTVFTDSSGDVVINANVCTSSEIEIKVIAQPYDVVGDIRRIEKTITLKNNAKADTIQVKKNGQIVATNETINIFDYYEEGNSLGALFQFDPIANSGVMVHEYLSKMKIIVDPTILSSDNYTNGDVGDLDSKLYSLNFHIFDNGIENVDNLMEFTYNPTTNKMESQPISSSSRVYIKYVNGKGTIEPTYFGIQLKTIIDSSVITYWEDVVPTAVDVSFNRVEGIKTLNLQAGNYAIVGGKGDHEPIGIDNPQYVYLNRLKGLDSGVADGYQLPVLSVGKAIGADGAEIPTGLLEVEVINSSNATNPVAIYNGVAWLDTPTYQYQGTNKTSFMFTTADDDLISLVFRRNTDIGYYEIVFKQEGITKASIIVCIYQDISELDQSAVSIETNSKAFKNNDYQEDYKANYIVASGQELNISIDIDDDVLLSDVGLVEGYEFSFDIVDESGKAITFEDGDNKTNYFNYKHNDISLSEALLTFINGTIIKDEKCYVSLNINVLTKKFENIVTISNEPKKNEIPEIRFFIYNEITTNDISINHSSLTRYSAKYLSVYYTELSKDTLEINMQEDLWNYVTGAKKVDWRLEGQDISELNRDLDSDGENDCFYQSGVTIKLDPELDRCDLNFERIAGTNVYTRTVKAYVYQFGNRFELQCIYTIEKPILTERLEITSPVESSGDGYYINLKNGGQYQVTANNVSSLGKVTNPEIIIQIYDEGGTAYNAKEYFDINQTTSTITVIKVDNLHKFKLIVFARDVLKETATSDKPGYNAPQSFIMNNFTGDDIFDLDRYLNAYFVMDVYLSDGKTEETAYLISSADDFWQIDDREDYRSEDTYWKLMNSISLNNTVDTNEKTISNFAGNIITHRNEVFNIDGFTLGSGAVNLFRGFNGDIKNIKFKVDYAYNLSNGNDNLGLFDINRGNLTNVYVEISGEAQLDGNGTYYFGGLVGVNYGTIIYENGIGVQGNIGKIGGELRGSATVYFGGLVGKNVGKILGSESDTSDLSGNTIEISSSSGRVDALSQIVIYSSLTKDSAIGGVVGLNTYEDSVGIVQNAYVQAQIFASLTDNVGGVVGKNIQEELSWTVNKGDYYIEISNDVLDSILTDTYIQQSIYNVKSASIIEARDNVGGIVGSDENGLYIDCDYQVLNIGNKIIAIIGTNKVGGIAGSSTAGKFAYCSVMSYAWKYDLISESDTEKLQQAILGPADIQAVDYVGGIVGFSVSSSGAWVVGPVETEKHTVVVSSSVNAYVEATATGANGNVGGILASGGGTSVLYNVYFIGKVQGKIVYSTQTTDEGSVDEKVHYLVLDNNGSSFYNVAYSLNIEQNGDAFNLAMGNVQNGEVLNIEDGNDIRSYWWWNEDINGGYIFVTKDKTGNDSSLPIFDVAPESISVSVKDEHNESVAVGVRDEDKDSLKQVLMLYYYDFSINDGVNETKLLELNEKYNRSKYILNIFDIQAFPSGIGSVAINVKSTKPNVVDITYDGRILVNKVGECELIFTSVLNPDKATARIKVVVDYPIGDVDNFKLTSGDKIVGAQQRVEKGKSVQYYASTSGKIVENPFTTQDEYFYRTKSNLSFNVDIEYGEGGSDFNIEQYLLVTGVVDRTLTTKTKLVVNIDEKTPFLLSVLDRLETGAFEVAITPYRKVNDVIVCYLNTKTIIEDDVIQKTFSLETQEGASNVAFSYDRAFVYPNDTVYLNAYVNTDKKITDRADIFASMVLVGNSIYKYELDSVTSTDDYKEYIVVKVDTNLKTEKEIGRLVIYIYDLSKYEDKVQTISFRIEFYEFNIDRENFEEIDLELQYVLSDNNYSCVRYTILCQRITKIEIKNFYYDVDGATINKVQADILKPNHTGLILIDLVPNNAYYSYLEISDVTGNEEILFVQVDEDDHALSLNYDPSSDGKGIKLYHYEGQDFSRLYVRTQISNQYSSKIHAIEVRAYSADEVLLASFRKYIDVKMMPEISVNYMLPNGNVGAIVQTAENRTGLVLANGVDANFRIETKNSNSELSRSITSSDSNNLANKYELINESGDLWLLKRKDGLEVVNTDIGKTLTLNFETYYYLDNGDYDKATCSITFTIVDYVIHGVSVNQSIDNANTSQIYGYFDRTINLKFYFDADDISFYDVTASGNKYWDTTYEYDAGFASKYESGSVLYSIYSTLAALNSYDGDGKNQYLVLNDNTKQTENPYLYSAIASDDKITLSHNKLTVKENYTTKYLAVMFKMTFDVNNNCSISPFGGELLHYEYVVDKNYRLEFVEVTPWHDPMVISTAEEFKAMKSGGSYILKNDLIGSEALIDYSPIDVNLVEFDGNGHTIEIVSFATFNDVSIQAGLFKQIYEDMIVKNVKVKYSSKIINGNYTFGNVSSDKVTYLDLCNNKDVSYTEAKFGGIAAINNGIITNCVVEGRIAVHASTLENKTISGGGNYQVAFEIGGLIAENTSSAYVTNCVSNLQIFAQANVAGFVHTNSGKIVSSGVESKTTMYGYNTNLGNTIIVEMAGFAIENSGEISMSYVNLNKGEEAVKTTYYGTMSAKDISAGFVYSNSGKISDAYVQMTATGVNNNTFAGFAYSNSGKITRAYTYINNGARVDNNDSMFAPVGTLGIFDSIEIVDVRAGYSNGIASGLKTIDTSDRYNKSNFEKLGFAFGDNSSSVWSMISGSLPTISSTKEALFENFEKTNIIAQDTIIEDGYEKTTYKIIYSTYGTKNNPYIVHNLETWDYYFNRENNNGIMTGYYRIVRDIDFSSVGDNPTTSDLSFSGNIQGNNMQLTGIMLYSKDKLESIGLFASLVGSNDISVKNSIRNLTISTTSVWASSTKAVGVLAGLIENFNIYNITIDSPNVILVGGNAVGGLAGLVRGEFDIDKISSNVGANSTRVSITSNYSIYMSKNNNKDVSSNLANVYYAGSVVGILDGYNRSAYNINNTREIAKNYNMVRNISVSGNLTIVGDIVGGAFGVVGERVYVQRVSINVSGSLFGSQFSAGIAGENRGVINGDIKVNLADEIFARSNYVTAGAVGFNLGGLVKGISVEANILKKDYSQTVGGIVGRNVYGTISDAHFDGLLQGYYLGGIVGVDYTAQMIIKASTGSGALTLDCKDNNRLIPSKEVEYFENSQPIEIYDNVSLGRKAFEYLVETSNKYYSYKTTDQVSYNLNTITVKSKVLGLVVGLSYRSSVMKGIDEFNIDFNANSIKFNPTNESGEYYKQGISFDRNDPSTTADDSRFNMVLKEATASSDAISYTFDKLNIVDMSLDKNYVMYILGSTVTAFDSWMTYGGEYILVQ